MARKPTSKYLIDALPALAVLAALPFMLGAEQSADDAWVRIAPPGVRIHSGYFEFQNPSAAHLRIVGASSPAYERVELHQSKVVDGIASMEPLNWVAVPSGGSVSFQPGGKHLMLINPKQSITRGQKIEIELKLSNGSVVSTQALAKSIGRSHAHRGSHQ